MKRILSILKIIGLALAGIILLSSALLSVATAYIVFAPDDLPKPFYLVYAEAPSFPLNPVEPATPPLSENPEPPNAPHSYYVGEPVAGGAVLKVDPSSIEPGDGLMLNTGTKIVNLAEPGGRKYLKTTIVLEFAFIVPEDQETVSKDEEHSEDDPTAAIYDELNGRLPVINDVLTSLLSSKSFESIYTAEGKEQLRAEIMATLATRLPDYPLVYVYFTEFVIQ